jgi:hypothetical protein
MRPPRNKDEIRSSFMPLFFEIQVLVSSFPTRTGNKCGQVLALLKGPRHPWKNPGREPNRKWAFSYESA